MPALTLRRVFHLRRGLLAHHTTAELATELWHGRAALIEVHGRQWAAEILIEVGAWEARAASEGATETATEASEALLEAASEHGHVKAVVSTRLRSFESR